MISSTKVILLLFSTVINPVLAHYGGSTTQEKYFLNDTKTLCHNLTYANPLIFYVSNFVIKCVSPQPIHWNVSFKFCKGMERGVMPYQVESVWKSCRSTNQAERNFYIPEKYFEIVLRFDANQVHNWIQSILIKCVNTLNSTQSVSWNTKIEDKSVNLNRGYIMLEGKLTPRERPKNQQPRPVTCSSNILLASGASGLDYNCFTTRTKQSITVMHVQKLKCDNWINCEQLAAFTFKKRCPTAWKPSFCDSIFIPCVKHQELVSTNSGIIYCQISGGTFYLPYFKNNSAGASKPLYVISDVESDSLALVSLTEQQIYETVGPNVMNFEFNCSAPKFVALKGFEWTAIYSISSSAYMAEEFCNTTRLESPDSYIENFICSIISDESLTEINVTCAVHLQIGKMVQKTSSEKFHSSVIASDSPQSPILPESSPKTSGDWPPVLIAIAGMAGCFVILLPIFIFYHLTFRRQSKPTLISAEDVDNFLKEPTLLGKGAFGEVRKGKIGQRYVAIKTVNKAADGQYFLALLSELKIMSFVGKHANIVELVGANTERIRKQDVFLIFEFCENGNVLEYIRARREDFVDQLNLCENSNGVQNIGSTVVYENGLSRRLCSEDLIRWATEITTGMDFIASKNVYHGDLAARNILLTHHLVAKVGDFGLAKDLKDYALYVQRLECPLPLKWMSIESLRDLEFSIQSDVWSFGITMWEIFSLGSKPYPGVEWNFQAWKRLQDGERMDRPSHATESMYNILLKCWESQPQDRPTFSELKQMFKCELDRLPIC